MKQSNHISALSYSNYPYHSQSGKAFVFTAVCLVSLAASILFLNTATIFILLSLIPSIIAYYYDEFQEKNIFKTVLACNLCGIAIVLHDVFLADSIAARVQVKYESLQPWLIVFGSSIGGAVLILIGRISSYYVIKNQCNTKVKNLRKAQEQLIDEWGEDIQNYNQLPKTKAKKSR